MQTNIESKNMYLKDLHNVMKIYLSIVQNLYYTYLYLTMSSSLKFSQIIVLYI